MHDNNFDSNLREKAKLVDDTLEQLMAAWELTEPHLKDALRYTLGAPGKRVRAALTLWCCELIAGDVNRNAEIAAAAIEMVHTYSLVHDDLPAIDNDDMRRGVPTCHKAFDEATAILTGDALLTFSFEVLANEIDRPETAVKLIARLATEAGASGMIAGQIADLRAEKTACGEEVLRYIHTNKTAKMFRCAAASGAICADATDEQLERLCDFGLKIGLGFQVADDILDVSASSEQLGKTAGKDARAAKCTYPAVIGIEAARELERSLAEQAVAQLEPFGKKADTLRQLAMALLERIK